MAAPIASFEAFPEQGRNFEVIAGGKSSTPDDISQTEETNRLYVHDCDIETAPTTPEGLSITSLKAVLSNNSKYRAKITMPVEPKISYGQMVEKSPAWWTDEDDPFNVHWTAILAEKGMTVVDTSHEHVLHKDPRKTIKRFIASSLLNDTHAQLAILQMIRDEKLAGDVSDEIIGAGLSKSSITSSLMIGRAADYNLRIPYVDGIDPSGEHPWGKSDLRALSRIGIGTLTEMKELAAILAEHSPLELADTIAHHIFMSPQAYAGHLAATKSLVLSEAGRDFIAPSSDSIMHITCFRNCWFNQHRGWMQRLGNLENVHIETMPGGHLKGARKKIRQASVERIVRVLDLLSEGFAPQGIDPATQAPHQPLAA
jgi:hypothetical protein